MNPNEQNLSQSEDQKDSNKSWYSFGNRRTDQRLDHGVLNIPEDAIDYDMNHKSYGKCLIFNHEFYEDNVCPQRKGSTADANALFQCFNDIGFEVKVKNDLTCDQLFRYINEVSKEDHSDSNCFVCCILTHGHNDNLWAKDQLYSLDTLLSFFTGDNCKSLAAKPKIFIIQACRGHEYDAGVEVRVAKDVCDSGNATKTVKIPVYADYLIAYSSMAGYYSWRSPSEGSWFVNHLTEEVNKRRNCLDLMSILTIVNQKIAYNMSSRTLDVETRDKKQVPCISHTLTRRILFKTSDDIQSIYL